MAEAVNVEAVDEQDNAQRIQNSTNKGKEKSGEMLGVHTKE